MAVTVRTTQTNTLNTNGTSFTIPKPTGLAAGDIMVALIRFEHGSAGTIATPTGWSAPQAQNNFATDSSAAKVFVKIADAGDTAAANFTFSSDTSARRQGILMAFSNVGTTDVSNSGTTTDGSASSSGTTPNNKDFFLILVAGKGNGACSGMTAASYAIATDNPTWTELADISDNNAGGNGFGISAAYASRSQQTATGNATSTITPNSGSIVGSALFLVGLTEYLIISPSVITSTATVLAPTVTGGATVSPSTITATATVLTPEAGQADWSAKKKTSGASWSSQSKS